MIRDEILKDIQEKAKRAFNSSSDSPRVVISPLTAMALLKEIVDLRKIAKAAEAQKCSTCRGKSMSLNIAIREWRHD